MASATTPAVQAPEPERVSSIGRIFGSLFSPKATFESIARRPTWLLPVLLLCIAQIGVVATFSHRVGWRGMIEKQMQNDSRIQQMPADQQQRVLDAQVKYAPIATYAVSMVAPFWVVVIFAAIYLAMFNLLNGAQLKFSTSLAVVAYASTPSIIAALLGILVLFLKDPSTVDLQHLVASNAGAFMPEGSSKGLVAFLSTIDLFSFWGMILGAMGFRAAAPKELTFGKAFVSILGLWLIYVLARVGLTVAFS